jgi:MYXO-CTERM domain-containing protein
MLPRALSVVVVLLLAGPSLGVSEAQAARTPAHVTASPGLELADGRVTIDARDLQWRAQPKHASTQRSVARLRRELGQAWIAWDDATLVPRRIMLEGLDAPGVMDSSDRAADVSREVLARHLAVLAPGAAVDDFVLVGNHVGSGIRSVGFAQTSDGREVVGGAISFRFKNDRLIAIASDAWPNVPKALAGARIVETHARVRASDWVIRDLAPTHLDELGTADTIVLPVLVDGTLSYREVVRVALDTHGPRSRFTVYVDAATGEPVARKQDLMFAQGGVAYSVPVRGPLAGRATYGAPFVQVVVDGASTTTDGGGAFPFTTGAASASNSPLGTFVALIDSAGPVGQASFTPQDGSAFVWDAASVEFLDAQLTSYVHASVVKQYVRPLATDIPWIDGQLQVTVNIDDTCNAFSDGDSINFYRSSESCENTGLIADVVYHEFGHSIHTQSVIPGVGSFNTSLSEGTSDYLSATIVNDSGVGRGFFYDDSPLRELNPSDKEYRWPDDRGEVHDEGRIIGGALWDLRELLVAKYGQTVGVQITDRIWYESTRRAVDIPSMYVEALVVDDDDGNLANGTPNGCEINAAYGPHGLFSAGEGGAVVTASGDVGHVDIVVQYALPSFPDCPVAANPSLEWQYRDEPELGTGSLVMSPGPSGTFVAALEGLVEGSVLQYKISSNYTNGTLGALPDNFVDPWYERYIGEVVPIFCSGFEDLAAGWVLSGDFAAGIPSGGGLDPASGVTTIEVLANALAGNYSPNASSTATSPAVVTTNFVSVRLQYQRWLTVEDGFFDQANISVDGVPVWTASATEDQEFATFHHIDKEWRFHDVDITDLATDGQVQVAFAMASDGGLELGGWTVDDFCVVGVQPTTGPFCGNAVVDAGEGCDDGNLLAGDGCDAACQIEGGGTDEGGSGDEQSDTSDGSGSDDAGQDDDGLVGRGCGCTTRGSDPRPLAFALVGFGALALRRRRRS